MKAFTESQFAYCPLIWIFSQGPSNTRINHLYKRALRIGYNDKSLGRFKYCSIKLYVLIGSDFVHYVIKWMAKGREMPAGTGIVVEAKTKRKGKAAS